MLSAHQVLERIPCAAILASPDQNRTVFDPVKLAELAGSIAETGLRQPILVRRESDLTGDRFVLVAGERRLRACRDILGLEEIDAIVEDSPRDLRAALGTLAENMIREDPDPIDEARGLAGTAAEFGLELADLARRLGKNPRWVAGRVALLQLAPDVAAFVQSKNLPIERGVLMSRLDANRQRLALAAHQSHIRTDAFRELVARLADEQAADTMFDTDSFLRLEEYVAEAEAIVAEEESPVVIVREVPVGIAEIAQLLEVKLQTVNTWRHRGILPEPAFQLSGSPAWWKEDIEEWARATGRL
jgi:ParB family chromosome partitioning protein